MKKRVKKQERKNRKEKTGKGKQERKNRKGKTGKEKQERKNRKEKTGKVIDRKPRKMIYRSKKYI